MNVSSINFEPLLKAHPKEAESIGRLEGLLKSSAKEPAQHLWTLDRLCDIVQPKSRDELSLILGDLIQKNLLDYEIQIESPVTHQVVKRLKTIKKAVTEIVDSSTGMRIVVTPEDYRFVYAYPKR
jgi:hypothetical protein